MSALPPFDGPSNAPQGLRRAYRFEWWIFTATAVSLIVLVLFPTLLRGRTEGLLHPHGYCYIWDTALVSSHVIADSLIGLAYLAISVMLGILVYRVRDLLPFHWMFLAFGLFILTCGATHFMEVWTLWHADFWASAALKMVTAVASVATALALPPLIPAVSHMLRAAALSEQRRQQLTAARRGREEAEAASRAKDLFLATLSHELRTPLNAIAGWTQLLHTQIQDPGLRKATEAIQRNALLQTRLVQDMLDASSIVTGRLQLDKVPLELGEVVRQAAEIVKGAAIEKGLNYDVRVPAEPIRVTADPSRLQQVITNLAGNAVKFTDAAGSIVVELTREGRDAVIVIRDTGMGIDPEMLPRIFDAFVQADQSPTRANGGLGLGLAIVRHLVEQHGGTVTASSEGLSRGSAFTVRLPIN